MRSGASLALVSAAGKLPAVLKAGGQASSGRRPGPRGTGLLALGHILPCLLKQCLLKAARSLDDIIDPGGSPDSVPACQAWWQAGTFSPGERTCSMSARFLRGSREAIGLKSGRFPTPRRHMGCDNHRHRKAGSAYAGLGCDTPPITRQQLAHASPRASGPRAPRPA